MCASRQSRCSGSGVGTPGCQDKEFCVPMRRFWICWLSSPVLLRLGSLVSWQDSLVIPKLRGTVAQSMPLFVSLCSYLSKSPVGTSSLWLYSHVLGLWYGDTYYILIISTVIVLYREFMLLSQTLCSPVHLLLPCAFADVVLGAQHWAGILADCRMSLSVRGQHF